MVLVRLIIMIIKYEMCKKNKRIQVICQYGQSTCKGCCGEQPVANYPRLPQTSVPCGILTNTEWSYLLVNVPSINCE